MSNIDVDNLERFDRPSNVMLSVGTLTNSVIMLGLELD